MRKEQCIPEQVLNLNGARLYPGLIDVRAQERLIAEVRQIVAEAPLFQPRTASGRKMRVRMTSAGDFGWVSEPTGYRYAPRHPSGVLWPPIPQMLLELWGRLLPDARAPECCLVNFYGKGARMGLHQDRDEADFSQPVLSVSLGDDGLFRIGGAQRRGPTISHWLRSGDVLLLDGPARLAFHGVDRIRFGSSQLMRAGGRLNLTLRVVT